jgi:carboxylate-amine ligase
MNGPSTLSRPEIPTLGVEIEYQMIDPASWELSSETQAVLAEGAQIYGAHIRPEFHAPVVECVTTVCRTVKDVREQVGELLRTLIGLCRKHGLMVAAASTHPITHWAKVKLTPGERYLQIQKDLGDISRSNLIYGMHCHLGIEDPDARIAVMNAMRYFVPHFLALSVSSPFWQGRDTGLASSRTGIFRRFPRTGMPDYFTNFAEFDQYVKTLIETGCIDNAKKIYWDIRPHPFYPTIEIRACDVPTTLRETMAIVAFMQVVGTRLLHLYRRNMGYRLFRRALINENMYRAMRHGIAGSFIEFATKKVVPVRESIAAILDDMSDEVRHLGVEEEISWIFQILDRGTSADRQRAAFARRGELTDVVDAVVRETMEDVV